MGISVSRAPKRTPVECSGSYNEWRLKRRIKFNQIILSALTKRLQPSQQYVQMLFRYILSFKFCMFGKMNLNLEAFIDSKNKWSL